LSEDDGKARVLFVCSTNSGRSFMAAAFLHAFAQGRVTVLSAVADRSAPLDPGVIEAMAEAGIHDLQMYEPVVLTRGVAESADFTVALNCAIDGLGRVDSDWRLLEPAGKPLDEIRAMRDEIRVAAQALAKRFLEAVISTN
jgi:arsenate reductase